MVVFRILWAFLTSRWLWTFIGLALLGALALTVSFLSNRGAVAAQADEFDRLRTVLAPVSYTHLTLPTKA